MHQHEHAAHGVEIEPGTPAWSEWVKDYYRDVETYDWVDVADNLRGLEAFFHRNRAWVVRKMVAKYATPNAPILDAGCGTGLNLRHLPEGSDGRRHQPAQRRAAPARACRTTPSSRATSRPCRSPTPASGRSSAPRSSSTSPIRPRRSPSTAGSSSRVASSSGRSRRGRRSGSCASCRAPARTASRSTTSTCPTRSARC